MTTIMLPPGGDLDDSSSSTGTAYTSSSSSTVLGPGAIAGKFLKAVGEKSLDLVASMVIRMRLGVIERTLERNPRVLRNPNGDREWATMLRIYTDLHELCRRSRKECYPLSVRRTAATLIRDITLITRSSPEHFIDASPTNQKWEALLARIEPEETVDKPKRRESISSYLASSTNEKWEALLARVQRRESQGVPKSSSRRNSNSSQTQSAESENGGNSIIVDSPIEMKNSSECADDEQNRGSSFLRDRLFKRRSSEPPESLPAQSYDNSRKILVLGAGGVGKSTLVRQIQATVQEFSQRDAEPYGDIILHNIMDSMRSILLDVDPLDFSEDARNAFQQVMACVLEGPHPTPSLGDAIRTLWRDPAVRHSARRSRLGMLKEPGLESTDYFVDSVQRIFAQDYKPTHEDVVRSRICTTGIWESVLRIGDSPWLVVDTGGERSERKKWANCYENTTAVLFVVALSDYNKTLYEDPQVNRMDESLALFESIANSPWFTKCLIVLLFNKVDAFVETLGYSPLKNYYPDYSGEDSHDACHYFERRFLSLLEVKTRPVVMKYTCAINAGATIGTIQSIKAEINRHHAQNMS